MKKCEYCGHINEDIFKVCARCGRGLPSKPNMTENEYKQQKKENVIKSEIETLSNEDIIRVMYESNDERLQSIERILARQTKDIHLITNCIVFLTVVVALELIASLIFGINLASAFSGLLS